MASFARYDTFRKDTHNFSIEASLSKASSFPAVDIRITVDLDNLAMVIDLLDVHAI